jgi:putative ABC transport system substrate-binding protein
MRRREFLVATMAVAMSRPVRAQTEARPSTTKRIAIFHPSEPPEALSINGLRIYKAYLGELERLGYTEGQNLVVERWSALGKIDRYTRHLRNWSGYSAAQGPNPDYPDFVCEC